LVEEEMGKKKNGRRGKGGVPGALKARSTGCLPFRDTIAGNFTSDGTTNASFQCKPDLLLPSLGNTRSFVFRRFIVEVIPDLSAGNVPEALAQLQFLDRDGDITCMQPYKLLSGINPTLFVLDIDALAKMFPAVKGPYNTTPGQSQCFRIVIPQAGTYKLKITTFVDILPQLDLDRVTITNGVRTVRKWDFPQNAVIDLVPPSIGGLTL
jgi:hypothetical protein